MYKFYVDRIGESVNGNKPYPNLATHHAQPFTKEWRKFSVNRPFSEPVMLFEYMEYWNIDYKLVDLNDTDNDTFYPIALSFFDFSVDWFKLFPDEVLSRVQNYQLRVLFFYSEGDNPNRIDEHLTDQCWRNNVPREQVLFVSANSAATNIPYFAHFVDDELLYNFRNRKIKPVEYHESYRGKKFTALSRVHKSWRANTMARIWEPGLHTQGYFSYNTDISTDTPEDNPIEVDNFDNLREITELFLSNAPYNADNLTSSQHNDHTLSVIDHFNNSYLNIVLETHMDVDQSNGVFLTEKVFKAIKNAQPFIIFGAAGSLQQLRDIGYRVFDSVIDNSYDQEPNTSRRWEQAINLTLNLINLNNKQLYDFYRACREDLIHNQQLFLSDKSSRISKLFEDLDD